MHTVDRMQSSTMLKQVVHIFTTVYAKGAVVFSVNSNKACNLASRCPSNLGAGVAITL
jgi:hypothetical protein